MGDRHKVLRRDVRACFEAAINAVDPERLVASFLSDTAGHTESFEPAGRVWIAGIGKAAAAMSRGAAAALGSRLAGGVLIVPAGQRGAAAGLEVFEGGHPIPSDEGVAGAGAIRRLASNLSRARAEDLLLVLISGGGSALMTLPPAGISLADVQATTGALLKAGADIGALNTVRKHLDLLKGGQLARAASPARVVALVLSDVVGDPLELIASGPVSPDPSTFAMAVEVLQRYDLWSAVPSAVRKHLESGVEGSIPDTPGLGDDCLRNSVAHIVGNNQMAAEAACREAERLGYGVDLTSTSVTGEAAEVGAELARTALGVVNSEKAVPACIVSAGETTVTVRGSGQGGRNQEVALGAAIGLGVEHAVEVPILIASAGTDGIDGPTDAAGAIATEDTLQRAEVLGLDAHKALADNDSYAFFGALEDLIVTGATGTNVMDLQFVLVGAPSEQPA